MTKQSGFRFSIISLLLLTALVAMGFGWWIDRNRILMDLERNRLEYDVGQKNVDRRLNAVQRLSKIASIDSAPALIYALGDPDYRICDEASRGLEKLSGIKCRGPCRFDLNKDLGLFDQAEKEEIESVLEAEQELWFDWLAETRPDIEPVFDPYESVKENRRSNYWLRMIK